MSLLVRNAYDGQRRATVSIANDEIVTLNGITENNYKSSK